MQDGGAGVVGWECEGCRMRLWGMKDGDVRNAGWGCRDAG